MEVSFKNFMNENFNDVCDFLTCLCENNQNHINWNWARWEWMYFHPLFKRELSDKIGLWYYENELVGMATFDQYLWEAFFAVKEGFEELNNQALQYSIDNLSDENGLSIAVNKIDTEMLNLLLVNGFTECEQSENILCLNLAEKDLFYTVLPDYKVISMNEDKNIYKYNKLLWLGFDHGDEVDVSENAISERKTMLSAVHLNPSLSIIAIDDSGNYVSHCCCWYREDIDYVYIEPVCTIPAFRKKGLAKAVIFEALNRCKLLGAKKAYVISNDHFYKALGFNQDSHYSFYSRTK